MADPILKTQKVTGTIEMLLVRIRERFPQSGLLEACKELYSVAKDTDGTVEWISRPNYWIRIAIATFLLILILVVGYSVRQIELDVGQFGLAEFVQLVEAATNELILLGAGIVFLATLENRRKRRRVVKATNRLRCLAHIIDAHQLTKDPDRNMQAALPTKSSPKMKLNDYELGRYLDYCSEMLALVGKLGFLYVQNYDDPVANEAVNDLEDLTTGMSRKIWQKIMILRARAGQD
jgi:hypothetical protein